MTAQQLTGLGPRSNQWPVSPPVNVFALVSCIQVLCEVLHCMNVSYDTPSVEQTINGTIYSTCSTVVLVVLSVVF